MRNIKGLKAYTTYLKNKEKATNLMKKGDKQSWNKGISIWAELIYKQWRNATRNN